MPLSWGHGAQMPAKGPLAITLAHIGQRLVFETRSEIYLINSCSYSIGQTLISSDRKGQSSCHPNSGFRYSLRSSGWPWERAVRGHLMNSSPHCSCGWNCSSPHQPRRRGGGGPFGHAPVSVLQRLPLAQETCRKGRRSSAPDRGWRQDEGPLTQPPALHEPWGRGS